MLEHVVLFKAKAAATQEQRERMLEALMGLKSQIPGIIDATAGTNFSDRSRGYTQAFVVRFSDQKALAGYIPHPAHQHVVENFVKPTCEEILVVDYEF
jgi:hypothetical protein